MSFVTPGVHEAVKALFHGAFLTLAVIILLYTINAWWVFGGWRGLAAVLFYVSVCVVEGWKTLHHLRWLE